MENVFQTSDDHVFVHMSRVIIIIAVCPENKTTTGEAKEAPFRNVLIVCVVGEMGEIVSN